MDGLPPSLRSVRRGSAAIPAAVLLMLLVASPGGLGGTPPSPRESVASGTADRAGSVPLASNCDGGEWNTTHLRVWGSGCQAVFGVVYANSFTNDNLSLGYNFSFAIGAIAELTPGGAIVRLADPLDPASGSTAVRTQPGEVNVTMRLPTNVTSASGAWVANDTIWGSGPQWNASSTPLGLATLTVVFHLFNATAPGADGTLAYRVKIDLGVSGWPWASAADSLGIVVQALAAGGAHFAYNASSSTWLEEWNSNGTSYAGLTFGGTANATYPSSDATGLTVTEQTGLYPGGTPDRQAVTLLTFRGGPGNYSALSYDPWVTFNAAPLIVVGFPNQGPPTTDVVVLEFAPLVAVAGGALFVVVRWRVRREGEDLVAGIERIIEKGPPPGT